MRGLSTGIRPHYKTYGGRLRADLRQSGFVTTLKAEAVPAHVAVPAPQRLGDGNLHQAEWSEMAWWGNLRPEPGGTCSGPLTESTSKRELRGSLYRVTLAI